MHKLAAFLAALLGLATTPLMAEEITDQKDVSIEIISPKEGDKFSITKFPSVKYRVSLAGNAFEYRKNIYIYVDDKKVGRVRQLSGRYTLDRLLLGSHKICISIESENENLFSPSCINVIAYGPSDVKDCMIGCPAPEKQEETKTQNNDWVVPPFEYTPPRPLF